MRRRCRRLSGLRDGFEMDGAVEGLGMLGR